MVGEMIDGGTLARKGRPIRPQYGMILVKRRCELGALLVGRLYAEGVPVAGVDRLRLNAPLAVQDLPAAVRFALQPEDDLALASLLVSPLNGWSQDDLMHAAAPRPSRMPLRSEERRVGKDCVCPCNSKCLPYNLKHTSVTTTSSETF